MRRRPSVGLRPTLHFAVAVALTVAYVAFAVWASGPWRDELEHALGPVMAWVIPATLAYVPGIVIGMLMFTLLLSRYREPPLVAPAGTWPRGQWPAVTILIAAHNEEEGVAPTLEGIAGLTYAGSIEVVLADNNSTDRTADSAAAAALRLGLNYRRVFERAQGKHFALNTALKDVRTPLVVSVDADTVLQHVGCHTGVCRSLGPWGRFVPWAPAVDRSRDSFSASRSSP